MLPLELGWCCSNISRTGGGGGKDVFYLGCGVVNEERRKRNGNN